VGGRQQWDDGCGACARALLRATAAHHRLAAYGAACSGLGCRNRAGAGHRTRGVQPDRDSGEGAEASGDNHCCAWLQCQCRAASPTRSGGWVGAHPPAVRQSGQTLDHAKLTPRGVRALKQALFLAAWGASRGGANEFARLYERLVPRKGAFEERKREYIGKNKVVGRVAGQILTVPLSFPHPPPPPVV